MAKKTTTRKPLFGNSRSHALNATKRKQGLNLQTVYVNGKQEVMSVREARSLKNSKSVKEEKVQEIVEEAA